jgi:asparagine synthase (glutamine-hydrolysing)
MLDEGLINVSEYISDSWPDEKNPVKAMADFEWNNKLVNDLLWQEDRCSMSEGLEVRVPFLDPVLCHYVREKDPDELMPGGRAKVYMRNQLGKILPDEIMNRPKSGFQVDAVRFFHKHLERLSDTYLSRETVEKYGLFNPCFIDEVRAYKTPANLRWHYFMLYLMLTTHIWVDLFENEPGSSSLL